MKQLISILILLGALSASAADIVTATVTVTNAAGTTNGQTITVNADVRTWTNNVVISASQILTNETIGGAATNLFNHVGANAFSYTTLGRSGTNGITLRSDPGKTLTVTLSAGWGEVAYATNTLTTAIALRLPITVEAAAQQTNLSTRLVDALNLDAVTNQLKQAAPVAAQLVGTTNAQTISGNKTFSGVNHFTGSNYFGANVRFGSDAFLFNAIGDYNGTWSIGEDGSASFADALSVGGTGRFTNDLHVAGTTYLDDAQIQTTLGVGGVARFTNSVLVAGGLEVTGLQTNIYATGTNSFSDIAFRRYAVTSLANGNNAGVVVGTNTFVEVSGPSGAFTINGMTGSPSRDGHLVIIINQTGQDMTVAHQSGTDPTAANRIISLTGADRSTTGNGAAMFIYSAAASRWLLIYLDP